MEPKVLIGIPTAEFARNASFYDYVDGMVKPPNTLVTRAHGQSPARNRNVIIEQALINSCTHIFFIDDDVALRPDTLVELLKHEKDIVCGLTVMRNYPHLPIIFDRADENGRCHHHYLSDNEKGLIEIVACGLGCVLINTQIFMKMQKPWIRLGELESDQWTDDLGFFMRVRALGYKLFCDLNMPVGHQASCTLWPIRNEQGKWNTVVDTCGKDVMVTPQLSSELALA
jgi:hypothetical protein